MSDEQKKLKPEEAEDRAVKAPKVWKYGGTGHGPVIRFDGDPVVYRADDLTQEQIRRYIQETPGQTTFVPA